SFAGTAIDSHRTQRRTRVPSGTEEPGGVEKELKRVVFAATRARRSASIRHHLSPYAAQERATAFGSRCDSGSRERAPAAIVTALRECPPYADGDHRRISASTWNLGSFGYCRAKGAGCAPNC